MMNVNEMCFFLKVEICLASYMIKSVRKELGSSTKTGIGFYLQKLCFMWRLHNCKHDTILKKCNVPLECFLVFSPMSFFFLCVV